MQTIGTLDDMQRLLPDDFCLSVSHVPDNAPGEQWKASIYCPEQLLVREYARVYEGTSEYAIQAVMKAFILRMTTQALGAASDNHVPQKQAEELTGNTG